MNKNQGIQAMELELPNAGYAQLTKKPNRLILATEEAHKKRSKEL